MTSEPDTTYESVEALIARNDELDEWLVAELAQVDLSVKGGDAENWVAREVAAHLSEFPLFFAADLARWQEDPDAVIGRTHENDQRLEAIDSAGSRSPDELAEACRTAFSRLAEQLRQLDDADLRAMTNNVRHGAEPLTSFLERYVIGHKAGHLEQLAELREAASPEGTHDESKGDIS